jgi:hypothetical protein
MKQNTGLKALAGTVVLVVVLVLINSKHPNTPATEESDPNNMNAAIASQFNDNLREVAARLHETEKKLKHMQESNQKLASEIRDKPEQETSDASEENQDFKKEINTLKEQIEALQEEHHTDYPLNPEEPKATTSTEKSDVVVTEPSTPHWNPIQAAVAETKTHTPFYTIPAGADLGSVTLLSSLIGEVPSEGKLMQPLFPFSAVINRGDLMAANGIALPDELAGMKISGYAIGVGSFLDNISCVRAYVTSALFVFEDGHFVTAGSEEMRHSSELLNNESLGYLTTAYGNPCIKGKYITNAPQVLSAFMAAGGIQGAGSALSEWQMSYLGDAGGVMKHPTGSLAHFAAGGAANQSSVKVSEWLEKRIQGSFDLVYVPASLPNKNSKGFHANTVNLHFTKTIPLDKDNTGRLLNYGHQQNLSSDDSLR